jgi:molybdopterin converting factor small subunit
VTVEVRLSGALRAYAGGEGSVAVELPGDGPATVAALLDALEGRHPALVGRVRDERGALRRHMNVFVGADHVRDLGGLEAAVDGRAPVSILPAVSGGAARGGAPVARW